MSTVKEIEHAISKLSHKELSELRDWFAAFAADEWDRQIEEDAENGRLDALYERLQQENEGESEIPLDDILDNEELS